jgi:DNA-binding transcriptional ArsR family regulator
MENKGMTSDLRNYHIGRRFGIPSGPTWRSTFLTDAPLPLAKTSGRYPSPQLLRYLVQQPLTFDEGYKLSLSTTEGHKSILAELKDGIRQIRTDCVETRNTIEDNLGEKPSSVLAKVKMITERLEKLSTEAKSGSNNSSRKEETVVTKLNQLLKKMDKLVPIQENNKQGDATDLEDLVKHTIAMNEKVETQGEQVKALRDEVEVVKNDMKILRLENEKHFKRLEAKLSFVADTSCDILCAIKELRNADNKKELEIHQLKEIGQLKDCKEHEEPAAMSWAEEMENETPPASRPRTPRGNSYIQEPNEFVPNYEDASPAEPPGFEYEDLPNYNEEAGTVQQDSVTLSYQ